MTTTSSRISRRSFLAGAAALAGATPVLAACGSGSGGGSTTLTFLEPGDQPVGWDTVLGAVNKKLQKDKGLTLTIQWIGWTNYANSELLKYTSGEHFAGSDEAGWLHFSKLAEDGSLYPLDKAWASGKYPNLVKAVNAKAISANKFNGHLWGVPQVNNAYTNLGFVIRSDLATKNGVGAVSSYDDFERFLYSVKQHQHSTIPYGLDNGYVNNAPQLFDATGWSTPSTWLGVDATVSGGVLFAKVSDIKAGNARIVPLWDVPQVVDALKRIRRYYTDGILNHNALNIDKNTVYSLFGQGKYAAAISDTGGLTTSTYGATTTNVPGAQIELVLPFGRTPPPKPYTTFSAANNVVVNKKSGQLKQVMELQDWLSVRENHDLLQYGLEGKDWKPVGTDSYTPISKYNFPGYTLSWRVPLERTPSSMIPSEKHWFAWSQNFDHFQLSPLTGFTLNQTPIKTQLAQLSAAYTKYALPLFAGMVDTSKGLSDLKTGFDKAGINQIITEQQKQLTTFLKSHH